jgi:hypothetical protein
MEKGDQKGCAMKKGKTRFVVAAGFVVLTAAGVVYLLRPAKHTETKAATAVLETPSATAGAGQKPVSAQAATATGQVTRGHHKTIREADSSSAPTNDAALAKDRADADKMQTLLDDDDQTAALVIARKLMLSKDPEIRSEVVSTFGWIGVKALPELSVMLADESEDVGAEAFQQWKEAIDEVSDEARKAQLLALGMQTMIRQDELEEAVMEFNDLPEDLAVRSLVAVIQSSNPVASEVAREHYEFFTGDAYTTPADAEKWIAENVEPPAPAPAPTAEPAEK